MRLLKSPDVAHPCPSLPLHVPESAVGRPHRIIIAHRGASSHLPEHTLEGYRLALELGADYIEPDIVATRDGHLVAVHTMDLNITTNVAQVFPDRSPWYSPYQEREGYWTFNFTLEELQQLRVKQRLPRARNTEYDFQFQIPTLTEIMTLLKIWNRSIVPQLKLKPQDQQQTPYSEQQERIIVNAAAGVYLELKEPEWLEQDSGQDLIQLILEHMHDNPDLWKDATTCHRLKVEEYKVPPLIIQSFEADALKKFHSAWTERYGGAGDGDGLAPPPNILLVDKELCGEESFWFDVGETYREYLQGVGPNKVCLLSSIEEARGFMEQAEQFSLVVHPWTERPEREYVSDSFTAPLEEVIHLFCNIRIQGIFSESVSTAVTAAWMGCDDTQDQQEEQHPSPDADHNNNSNHGESSLCYETDQEEIAYVGLAAFVMGLFVASMLSLWMHKRREGGGGSRRRYVVPTEDHDLELT